MSKSRNATQEATDDSQVAEPGPDVTPVTVDAGLPIPAADVSPVTPNKAAVTLTNAFERAFDRVDKGEIGRRDAYAAANATHRALVKGSETMPAMGATDGWLHILGMVGTVNPIIGERLLADAKVGDSSVEPEKRVWTLRQYAQNSAWAKSANLPIGPSMAKKAHMLESRVADELPEGVDFGSWLAGQICETVADVTADDGTVTQVTVPPVTTLGALLAANPSTKAVRATPIAPVDGSADPSDDAATMASTTGRVTPIAPVDIHAVLNQFLADVKNWRKLPTATADQLKGAGAALKLIDEELQLLAVDVANAKASDATA